VLPSVCWRSLPPEDCWGLCRQLPALQRREMENQPVAVVRGSSVDLLLMGNSDGVFYTSNSHKLIALNQQYAAARVIVRQCPAGSGARQALERCVHGLRKPPVTPPAPTSVHTARSALPAQADVRPTGCTRPHVAIPPSTLVGVIMLECLHPRGSSRLWACRHQRHTPTYSRILVALGASRADPA